MMCTQQYALRWNNYSNHISGAFDMLRHDDALVDVTLSCDGGKIRAHKIMLSACSPYFHNLFKDNPCQHPIVVLRNVSYIDLSAIVSFMYQGEVSVVSEQLTSFLQTAEFLEVKGLTDSGRNSPEFSTRDDDSSDKIVDDDVEYKFDTPVEQNSPDNQIVKLESDSEKLVTGKKRKVVDNSSSGTPQSNKNNKNIENVSKCKSAKSLLLPEPVYVDNDSYNNEIGDELIDVSELCKKNNYIANVQSTLTSTTSKKKDETATDQSQSPSETNTPGTSVDQEDIKPTNAEEDDLLFRCRLCWKSFKHPMSLTLHKDAHEGKTECPVCRRHFSRSYDMRSHLTRIHKMTLSLDTKLDIADDKLN